MRKINNCFLVIGAAGMMALCGCAGEKSDKVVQPQTTKAAEVTTKAATATTKAATTKAADYSAFKTLLKEKKAALGEYGEYSVYDIDNDGVRELLLKEGTCEADYMYHVYKLNGNKAQDVGTFTGAHSMLYGNEDGAGIIAVSAVQGYERVALVTLKNSTLTEKLIREGDTKGADYYSNSLPLSVSYVTDAGLLEKDAKLIGGVLR